MRDTDVLVFVESGWLDMPYLLVKGSPTVVQLATRDDTTPYLFVGVAPLGRDADGHVTSFRQWRALCGSHDAHDEIVPMAAMTRLEDQLGCLTDDPQLVRRAVALGEGPSEVAEARWVRDVGPGDFRTERTRQ